MNTTLVLGKKPVNLRCAASLRRRSVPWHVLFVFMFIMIACACLTEGASFSTTIRISLTESNGPVNRELLGNNIQWVDSGDGLLLPGSNTFSPQMLAKTQALGPTVLRYPGGSLSDVYPWQSGIGQLEERGTAEHLGAGVWKTIYFGTPELEVLCQEVGAQPMITVNVPTGTAFDAAAWVGYINNPNNPFPHAKYWEIGNEPYYEAARPELQLTPEDFAVKANDFIRTMKAVDPTIQVGIPLHSDTIGGIPINFFPDYNRRILTGVTETFDYVSVHNSYFPIIYDWGSKTYTSQEIYLGTIAAAETAEADMAATRAILSEFYPSRQIPIAVTEYAPFFTIGVNPVDSYTQTVTGAIYVADMLRLYSESSDICMAAYWSLSGDWVFGTMSDQGVPRPIYHVLSKSSSSLFRGEYCPTTVSCKTLQTPRVGLVMPQDALPAVTTIVTREGNKIRMFAINKDPTQTASVRISFNIYKTVKTVTCEELWTSDYFQIIENDSFGWKPNSMTKIGSTVRGNLKPHSVNYIEITF